MIRSSDWHLRTTLKASFWHRQSLLQGTAPPGISPAQITLSFVGVFSCTSYSTGVSGSGSERGCLAPISTKIWRLIAVTASYRTACQTQSRFIKFYSTIDLHTAVSWIWREKITWSLMHAMLQWTWLNECQWGGREELTLYFEVNMFFWLTVITNQLNGWNTLNDVKLFDVDSLDCIWGVSKRRERCRHSQKPFTRIDVDIYTLQTHQIIISQLITDLIRIFKWTFFSILWWRGSFLGVATW